jgi:hypothetical protein
MNSAKIEKNGIQDSGKNILALPSDRNNL